jgi:nitroreductase
MQERHDVFESVLRGAQSMDALTAIASRVSPVQLDLPALPPEAVDKILQAAVAAPDHGRIRPWRFILIEGAAREKLGELMALCLRRREADVSPARLEAECKKALRAPLVIVVVAAVKTNPKVPDVEQIVAVGAAAQNMLLAAHALGFGGFWRTGAIAYDVETKKALNLSESDLIVGFLYLGSIKTPGRRPPIDAAEFTRRWSEP